MKKTPTKNSSFFLPNFCALQPALLLIIFSQLLAIIFVLVRFPMSSLPRNIFTLTSMYVLWITLTTAFIWCALHNRLQHWNEQAAACFCFIIPVIVTAFFNLIGQHFNQVSILIPSSQQLDWLSTLKQCIIAAIISGLILRYFYLSGQLEKQREAELLHRIQALQSRIQPHFLFNSMNIIASLIATDPDTAETAVESLAEVFRASLNKVQKQVPLAEELHICNQYLNLEQLRLGKRLCVSWDLPTSIPEHVTTPMLLIQPLIENAIYHGIDHLRDGGTVGISIKLDLPWVHILVRNPIPDKPSAVHRHSSNHLAIDNISHRLAAIYGPKAKLKHHYEDQTYCVEITYRLPSSNSPQS